MQNEEVKLKLCPFCGGEPVLQEHVFHGYRSTYGVICLDCCCETRQFYDTAQDAADAWNRRADSFLDYCPHCGAKMAAEPPKEADDV